VLKKLFFGLAIFYTLFLAVLSVISLKLLPSTGIDYADKIAHFAAYFLLYTLWYLSMKKELIAKYFILLFLGCIGYGIILELIQGEFTSERSADYLDAVANTVGVLSSVLVMYLLSKLNVKMRS